ncbi:MAG: phenylalanine--tRNA ligase subunit beta [Candidatus Marsarchaeota archaeon]|nr:phenylalanine--tRNA ligase subunit beta [Candidatus Marsarchaeota archaeon]
MAVYSIKKEKLGFLTDNQLKEGLPMIKCEVESFGEEIEIQTTSDRPDLLSVQGVERALKGFFGIETGIPSLSMETLRKSGVKVFKDSEILLIRPYIVSAVVKKKITEDDLIELMGVQERLHQTHGRKRKKISIGIHDASKLKPPFYYKAVKPESVSFTPLNEEKEMNLNEILEKTEKGKEYGFIIKSFDKYPILVDSENSVLSLPPIINGTLTTLKPGSSNLFIDITGTDFEACNATLNILCQDFMDMGGEIQTVEVVGEGETPQIKPETMILELNKANKLLGINLTAGEAAGFLKRQRLDAKADENNIKCRIPRYRTDFLHPVDLVEELAIGFGLNKFEPESPSLFTKGGLSSQTILTERIRNVLSADGFVEIANHVLTSEELMGKCLVKDFIRIQNPVSRDYSILRSELLPLLLETASKNTHHSYPQKIFEAGEVAGFDKVIQTNLNTSALILSSSASLTEIASHFSVFSKAVGFEFTFEKKEDMRFLKNRCLAVKVDGKERGVVGELNPEILESFGVGMPASAFEFTVLKLHSTKVKP